MMTFRRPPTTSEWIGLIVTMAGLALTVVYHAVLTAQAFQRTQDELGQIVVALCAHEAATLTECQARFTLPH